MERFAAAVRSLGADVLGMQEVDVHQPRSQLHDLTAIAAEAIGAVEHRFVAAMAGHRRWVARSDRRGAAGNSGVRRRAALPSAGAFLGGHPLPALPFQVPHLFPGRRRPVLVRDEPRVAIGAVVETPRGVMTVVTTHLSFIDGWNVVQLRRLRRSLAQALPGPLVLMGDLNMGQRRATRTTGMSSLATALTFPADRPTRQLDHVLARNLPSPPVSPPHMSWRCPTTGH